MTTKRLDRKFSKPTQISKHLCCSICTDVFFEPMRLFCGHTFCLDCINGWGKENNTCPECRGVIESSLAGKDLIAEKIIQDLEVLCVNKLCDWKDRLENLPKHVKSCAFAKTPDWLNQAQSNIRVEENPEPCDKYMQADEQFIERVNEEVPRKSLLERLYTKSAESQKLVKSVFDPKKKVGKKAAKNPVEKAKSFAEYDDFMCALGSDEETKEDQNDLLTLEMTPKDSPKSDPAQSQTAGKRIPGLTGSNSGSEKNSVENKGDITLGSNPSDIVEEESLENSGIEHTTPNRRSGRKRGGKKLSEPNLIKKSKTTVV